MVLVCFNLDMLFESVGAHSFVGLRRPQPKVAPCYVRHGSRGDSVVDRLLLGVLVLPVAEVLVRVLDVFHNGSTRHDSFLITC